MAAARRSRFGLQCLSEEERIDLEAMMTLYWHRHKQRMFALAWQHAG